MYAARPRGRPLNLGWPGRIQRFADSIKPRRALGCATFPAEPMNLTLEMIKAAAERLSGHIEKTPLRRSRTLSEITGAEVWIKFENQQFTAAYKERGALNKLLQLTENERERGVLAASA